MHIAPIVLRALLIGTLAVSPTAWAEDYDCCIDTLYKIEPENLRRQVALMAMMAYFVAEMPEALPRLAPSKPRAH